MLTACSLCPRECGANRLNGEKGFCNLGDVMVIQQALPHFGEEPPLSGVRGAGTIFFSSCNLKCIYCQNYQISHSQLGRPARESDCARMMLNLQAQGCHNIEVVSGTPHLAGLIGAIIDAVDKGLAIPLVYNCGGYESVEAVRHLEGIVDVYLPDFKYAREEYSYPLSGVRDYGARALDAIGEMASQVGATLEVEAGIAQAGMLIRHLVLPGMVENSLQVLRTIGENLSTSIPLSIMSQYTPATPMKDHALLGRRITKEEYEQVVNEAMNLGFEYLFVQNVDEEQLLPDFERDRPFQWK